jgi:uncharacterized RDD family membrane protein YckC
MSGELISAGSDSIEIEKQHGHVVPCGQAGLSMEVLGLNLATYSSYIWMTSEQHHMIQTPLFVPGGLGPLEMGIIFLILLLMVLPIVIGVFVYNLTKDDDLEEPVTAPLYLRFVAVYFVDGFVSTILFFMLLAILAVVGAGDVLFILSGLVVYLGYFVVLEAKYGYTLGKKLFDLEVRTVDGNSIGWEEAVIRNILRPIDSLPNFYIIGFLVALATDERQRLGDLAAKTIVLKTPSD